MELNFKKNGGYVIAIAQDLESGGIVHAGFVDPQGLSKSQQEQQPYFWSKEKKDYFIPSLSPLVTVGLTETLAAPNRDFVIYLVQTAQVQ